MGKVESIIKSGFMRLGKREVRKVLLPIKREVRDVFTAFIRNEENNETSSFR